MDDASLLTETSTDFIGRATSLEDIVNVLVERGCPDLTSSIDLSACTKFPLAGGGFCDVYQGAMSNGTKIALKSLRVFSRPGKEDDSKKIFKRAAREMYHWSKLKHPNVLPLMGLAIFREHMTMISEWMDNGCLMSYVRLNPNINRIGLGYATFTRREWQVHGDLKAANVMVSANGSAMIADFGNSKLRDLTLKFTNTTSSNFSFRWAAPEIMGAEDGPNSSKEADVYAYGMTALEALTGKVPYDDISEKRVFGLVAYEHKPPTRPDDGTSDEIWEILLSCWTWEVAKRPEITNVLERLKALPPHPLPDRLSVGGPVFIEDIVDILRKHGCPDLTSSITGSELPLATSEYCDLFQGSLGNAAKVAIKALKLQGRLQKNGDLNNILERVGKELYSLSGLKHPNVLPLVGLAVFRGQTSIVSEWIENGDLLSYVNLNPHVDRVGLCMDVCAGLSYIHANNIVHGDLRAGNVMISPDGVALIADLGNLQLRSLASKSSNATGPTLPVRWTAPELLDGGSEKLSKKADVYAYGMTALETLTGRSLSDLLGEHEAMCAATTKHTTPVRPVVGVSDEMWEIIQDCWILNQMERPDIVAIEKRLWASSVCTPGIVKGTDSSGVGELEMEDLSSSLPEVSESSEPRGAGEAEVKRLHEMAALASTHLSQGRLVDAASLTHEVVVSRRRVLGEDHPATLLAAAHLANIYHKQGRLADAEQLDVEVLAGQTRARGEDDLRTLQAMANLAVIYHAQDRLVEAASLKAKVVVVRRRILGADHPDTLQSMANLANTYYRQTKFEEAEALDVEVLTAREHQLGSSHVDTLQSMANLATTYHAQRRLEDAESLDLKVLAARSETLGKDHPATLRAVANLAATYEAQGRLTEAESLRGQL